jgi:hypothetical protein
MLVDLIDVVRKFMKVFPSEKQSEQNIRKKRGFLDSLHRLFSVFLQREMFNLIPDRRMDLTNLFQGGKALRSYFIIIPASPPAFGDGTARNLFYIFFGVHLLQSFVNNPKRPVLADIFMYLFSNGHPIGFVFEFVDSQENDLFRPG